MSVEGFRFVRVGKGTNNDITFYSYDGGKTIDINGTRTGPPFMLEGKCNRAQAVKQIRSVFGSTYIDPITEETSISMTPIGYEYVRAVNWLASKKYKPDMTDFDWSYCSHLLYNPQCLGLIDPGKVHPHFCMRSLYDTYLDSLQGWARYKAKAVLWVRYQLWYFFSGRAWQ